MSLFMPLSAEFFILGCHLQGIRMPHTGNTLAANNIMQICVFIICI